MRPAIHAHLLEHASDMYLGGVNADAHPFRNLLVVCPSEQHLVRDVLFRRELIQKRNFVLGVVWRRSYVFGRATCHILQSQAMA